MSLLATTTSVNTTATAPAFAPAAPASAPAPHRRGAEVPVTLDLTSVGVPVGGLDEVFEPEALKADLGRLARLAGAAHAAGAAAITLGPDFRLASGRRRAPDAWLDPAVAVRRLAGHVGDAAVVPALSVPRDGLSAAISLARVARKDGWAALDVAAAIDPFGVQDTSALQAELVRGVARELGVGEVAPGDRPRLVVRVRTVDEAATAGRYADVVRVHEHDPEAARALREAAREGARAAGREPGEVNVLADVRVVVSTNAAAARERILLLDALAPGTAPGLDAVGAAQDVLDLVEAWVAGGVADGVVARPGSLQADLPALVGAVLPGLTAARA